MDNEKIGKFIKERRKEKGLTQQKLGDMVGVSFKAVSKWECGNSMPDISVLKRVCDVLDLRVDELLNCSPNKDNNSNENGNLLFKNKKLLGGVILIIIVIIIIGLLIINNKNYDNNIIDKDYECVLTKTYNVNNINESNDENYLYITFKEFQVEGAYTIKLSKTNSKDLLVGKNYEFTFNINKEFVNETADKIFNNSEIINIVSSNKVGNEQKNEFQCK